MMTQAFHPDLHRIYLIKQNTDPTSGWYFLRLSTSQELTRGNKSREMTLRLTIKTQTNGVHV